MKAPATDRRALAMAITRAAGASVAEVLAAPAAPAPGASVIGVTGAPGAGKSTLIGRLVAHRVRDDRPTAVLAIDPSSPRSGGSLLGDRIRMEALGADPRV
ncbi:MAG: ATP/GTP-binding protein [Burkholderiales bacterium]|nr:ATP/GTP-binding protein [Burkholderiales bacterium]